MPVHKLIGDVSTRWGSTYAMILRIIEQQQAVCAVLVDDCKNWSKMLTDQELNTIEIVAAILEPFSFLTDALSGEKNITLSAVRPVLKHILEKLTTLKDEDARLAREIKLVIHTDISNCYGNADVAMLLNKAAFLDPRFRECVTELEPTIQEIVEECLSIMDSDSNHSPNLILSSRLHQSPHSSGQGSSMLQPMHRCLIVQTVKALRFLLQGRLAAVLEHIADGIPSLPNSTSNHNTLTPYQKLEVVL